MQTLVVSACKEKTEWLEAMADATTQDFISQRRALEETVAPIMQKLSEPRESSQLAVFRFILCSQMISTVETLVPLQEHAFSKQCFV